MAMADLLQTICSTLESASAALPAHEDIQPPADGVSLFDVKNEIFLSYLQNLVFYIMLKVDEFRARQYQQDGKAVAGLDRQVMEKLVELRIYLEKGVRPLESKLKYSLDKLLNAAEEADTKDKSRARQQERARAAEEIGGISDDEDNDKHDRHSGANGTRNGIEDDSGAEISDSAYRPNPGAFARPKAQADRTTYSRSAETGVYKPPRITPVALPTTDGERMARERAQQKRPRKSHAVDEFIREELTDAPISQPNIGAGDGLRGREKEKAMERKEYEEQRLTRLPDEKKKGSKQRRHVGGGEEDLEINFGGLDDLDFGSHGRRKRKTGISAGMDDGSRQIGEAWQKRVKRGTKGRRI